MKRLIVVGLMLILSGCAHHYCHPQRSMDTIERDYRECKYEALVATANLRSDNLRFSIDKGISRADIERACMYAKGYGIEFFNICKKYLPD